MTDKPSPPAVYGAISKVMAAIAVAGIAKDRKSGSADANDRAPKFVFRGIDDVYNALAPILSANQLMMLPRMISRTQVERMTSGQYAKAMFYTTVEAEFDLVCSVDGSCHVIRTFGEAMDTSDKSTNKAMSAAFKYAAMQAFCIPTEGDNDADATTHEVAPARTMQQKADAVPDDFDAGAAGFDVEAELRKATDKPALDAAWRANKGTLARIKSGNPEIYAALIKTAANVAETFGPKAPAQ